MRQVDKKLFRDIVEYIEGARNFVRGGLIPHDCDGHKQYVVKRSGREVVVAESFPDDFSDETICRVEEALYEAYIQKYGYDV